MNADSKKSHVVSYFLIAIGVALGVWSLSDDLLIGGGPGFGFVQGVVLAAGLLALVGAVWPKTLGVLLLVTYSSLLVALLVGEIALRTLMAPQFDSAFQTNDQYLYDLKPGVLKEYTHLEANGGKTHVYKTNSQGYRGGELRERTKVAKRVAVYGDSFIHAVFSKDEETFVARLAQMIKAKGESSVEVVNAGVAGYGPDQIAVRMQTEVQGLKPDLIIVSIFAGNDFGDLARNKLYKLNPNGQVERNKPVLAPEIVFQEKLGEHELRVRRLIRNVRDALRQSGENRDPIEVVNAAYSQQIREYEEFAINNDNIVSELRSDPYSADFSLVKNAPSAGFKTRLMRGVLTDIEEYAKASEVPLVFMLIPHPIDVMKGNHASGVVDWERWPEYDSEILIRTLEKLCAEKELQCLSLLEPFRDQGGADLYLKGGDDHWNNLGQEVAARELTRFLEQRALLH
ncbi:MAG: hypothetical protein ACFHXK_12675 [bacterium]